MPTSKRRRSANRPPRPAPRRSMQPPPLEGPEDALDALAAAQLRISRCLAAVLLLDGRRQVYDGLAYDLHEKVGGLADVLDYALCDDCREAGRPAPAEILLLSSSCTRSNPDVDDIALFDQLRAHCAGLGVWLLDWVVGDEDGMRSHAVLAARRDGGHAWPIAGT